MQNDISELVKHPYICTLKVHRLSCLQLKKIIDKITQTFTAIESARPRCKSGIQALCTLHISMEKATLLLRHCSESSKLYLAITGDKILLRCERIRISLESCLSQIQNMVPSILADQVQVTTVNAHLLAWLSSKRSISQIKPVLGGTGRLSLPYPRTNCKAVLQMKLMAALCLISRIIDDLRIATFTVESSEDEAGKVLLALLHQDIAASRSANVEELKAFKFAALRLHITSPLAILIEKRSIKKLLGKIHDTDPTKKKLLNYFLYLVRKYGKAIQGDRTESIATQDKKFLNHSIELESHMEKERLEAQADVFDLIDPPEEFKCPLSMRIMSDPVTIVNGQTFERLWIEKWFNEGHKTCPKTLTELFDLSTTPNFALKDLILKWCVGNGLITNIDPCLHTTSSLPWLHKFSSSSIASFGSTLEGLQLQISNVSFQSSETNNGLDSLNANTEDGFGSDLPWMKEFFYKYQSSPLANLANLAALPWASRRNVVEDVKNQLEENKGSHYMISTNCIKTLVSFLEDARHYRDSRAQKDGAELLLKFVRECGSEVPTLPKEAFYVLSTFMDSGITEEVLAMLEVLSSQPYYKSEIVASGVLSSILGVLENPNSKYHLAALRVLGNFSAHPDIGHHMIYLDYIQMLVPFLDDLLLAGYCLKIFRNLCNIEEAGVEFAESENCISSIGELLEVGTDEEQELATDVLLSLCYQREEFCELVMKEGIISSLDNISANGNSRWKLMAAELLQLLTNVTDGHAQECTILNSGLPPDTSKGSGEKPGGKKSSPKSSGLFGRKISIFSKLRH